MEVALAVRHIWRHKVWLLPVTLVALVAALAVTYHASLFPPALKSKSFEYGAARTQLLLESSDRSLTQLETPIAGLGQWAGVYAALLNSPPVLKEVGKQAHVPWQAISVSGQTMGTAEPTQTQRSAQILSADQSLSLIYNVDPAQPIINLYGQAPTAEQASSIVAAAVRSLQRYVGALETRRHVPSNERFSLQPLGAPVSGTLASGAGTVMGLMVALLVIGIGCLLILLIPRFLLNLRKAGALEHNGYPMAAVPPAQPTSNMLFTNSSSAELDSAHEHLERG